VKWQYSEKWHRQWRRNENIENHGITINERRKAKAKKISDGERYSCLWRSESIERKKTWKERKKKRRYIILVIDENSDNEKRRNLASLMIFIAWKYGKKMCHLNTMMKYSDVDVWKCDERNILNQERKSVSILMVISKEKRKKMMINEEMTINVNESGEMSQVVCSKMEAWYRK